DFLQYVSQKLRHQFWHALPAELADWYQKIAQPKLRGIETENKYAALKGKRAAVVLYSYYPADPRPRREAEALASAGMEIDLICLRENASELARETINGVSVRRVPIPRRRDSKLTYILQYGSFLAFCAGTLAYRAVRKRYHLVHVHNMPDVLVFSALVPK